MYLCCRKGWINRTINFRTLTTSLQMLKNNTRTRYFNIRFTIQSGTVNIYHLLIRRVAEPQKGPKGIQDEIISLTTEVCAKYSGISKDTWAVWPQQATGKTLLQCKRYREWSTGQVCCGCTSIKLWNNLANIAETNKKKSLQDIPAVTWLLHAFSSWLSSLGTERFLGKHKIIGVFIHLTCLFLTSQVMIQLCSLLPCMNDFAANIDEARETKMATHTKIRAEVCRDQQGGHFEHLIWT